MEEKEKMSEGITNTPVMSQSWRLVPPDEREVEGAFFGNEERTEMAEPVTPLPTPIVVQPEASPEPLGSIIVTDWKARIAGAGEFNARLRQARDEYERQERSIAAETRLRYLYAAGIVLFGLVVGILVAHFS